jgi:hypothetical protein
MLHVCFVADPSMHPNRHHPLRVRNLVQLACAIKRSAAAHAEHAEQLPLEEHELGLAYKYCMMKVSDYVDASYGSSSLLARAVKKLCMVEAQMVGADWQNVLRMMRMPDMHNELSKQFERLLEWVDIPGSCVKILES